MEQKYISCDFLNFAEINDDFVLSSVGSDYLGLALMGVFNAFKVGLGKRLLCCYISGLLPRELLRRQQQLGEAAPARKPNLLAITHPDYSTLTATSSLHHL